MTDDKQREIFKDNLVRLIGDTPQAEIAKALGVSPQVLNTWTQGKAFPRIDKMQKIADYFKIKKSDLLEEPPSPISKQAHDFMVNYHLLNQSERCLVDDLIEVLQDGQQDPGKLLAIIGRISELLHS